MASHRIDGWKWRDHLRSIYDAAPGPTGAAGALLALQDQYVTMVQLYNEYVFPFPSKQAAVGGDSFKAAMKSLQQRLEHYGQDTCYDPDTCPDEDRPAHVEAWVAEPLFDGRWPAEYYLGLDHTTPGVPEVVHVAMLWNQLVEVETVVEAIGPVQVALAEWLIAAEKQLSTAAPGEEPTARDKVASALRAAAESAGQVVMAAAKGAGMGLVVVAAAVGTGLLLWRSVRRRA